MMVRDSWGEHDASARGLAHDLARGFASDEELIETIDQLNDSVTSMVGADLSGVDLRGIPLQGLRWSAETRWPAQWEEQIRRNSVEIEPGLWEIRPGGVDRAIDALS